MTVFALAPKHNSPGKKDATGAFQPEAKAFVKLHGGKLAMFDNRNSDGDRARECLDSLALEAGKSHECIGIFSHGFRTGLQTGVRLGPRMIGPRSVGVWAEYLVRALRPDGKVALYACDAARDVDASRDDDMVKGPAGAGGFASTLTAEMEKLGWRGWLDAHVTTAHTTKNPYVRRFYADDQTDDGFWLVTPGHRLERAWKKHLKEPGFRLTFPMTSHDEIHEYLAWPSGQLVSYVEWLQQQASPAATATGEHQPASPPDDAQPG